MPMRAESLEVLEKADLAPAQARAIVRAIEIELAGATDVLATRHDLLLLRTELREEITGLRAEVHKGNAELRGELRAEIHASASGVARQMYLAVLGQSAVMLGFAYFVATHLR